MPDYEVYASSRENGCEGGDITGLAISGIWQWWQKQRIIEMINNRGERNRFWSYVYQNGRRIRDTQIEVQVVNSVNGPYLRTSADQTETNNLLELPIIHYDEVTRTWVFCH